MPLGEPIKEKYHLADLALDGKNVWGLERDIKSIDVMRANWREAARDSEGSRIRLTGWS